MTDELLKKSKLIKNFIMIEKIAIIVFCIITLKTYYWLGAQPNELSDKFRLAGIIGVVPR